MSSNAFMLPTLPQIPASGLNGTDTKGPAAFKSGPPGEPSDPGRSFSATLNQVSGRQHGSNQKTTPSDKPRAAYRGSGTDSASSQKMSKTTDRPHDSIKKVDASESQDSAPPTCPLPGSASMPSHPADLSTFENGSSAVEPQSDSSMTPGLRLLTDLMRYLHQQQQTDISPEATNQAFFEQHAFSTVPQGDSEGVAARFLEFWQWMSSLPSTAADGILSGQLESTGINGNVPLNSLLQMLGMTGAAWGIHPDNGSSEGSIMAASLEGAHLNEALHDTLLTPSQSLQTVVSESGKMAVAGQPNAETIMEALTRQVSENSQRIGLQTAIKADVEQPANPNSANEGLSTRLPEDVFDIKSAIQKSEMLAVDRLGDKISQIDGESKDSGLLFSQDQMSANLTRLENGAQSTEAAQRGLMSQTLNQIVQKAVLSLHNGQHEVQLHLKPDYLGHIRMQIISEGHQVAIKMVAEFPFVKDMLESNLQQLRADLQAQGLNIDELEVSVAHDFHAKGDLNQNAGAAKLRILKTDAVSDDGSSVKPGEAESRDGVSMAETAVDYFA